MRELDLGDRPWILGHRGAAADALENTLASFALARNQRADGIELDVQLSRDGTLFVFHDWTLERLAGERREVESSSVAELGEVRLEGAERIPTLAEALAHLPPHYPLNIELKRRKASRGALAAALAGAVADRAQVLVSSFDWELLSVVRELAPDLPLAPLADHDGAALLAAGEHLSAWSLHCHRRLADRPLVERASAAGRPVLAYTVDQASEARRLLARGVAGVFTNRPGALRHEIAATETGAGGA